MHDASLERLKKLDAHRPRLERAAARDPYGNGPALLQHNLDDARFERVFQQRIRADRASGIYDAHASDRIQNMEDRILAKSAEITALEAQRVNERGLR